jgi:hypothetical protein
MIPVFLAPEDRVEAERIARLRQKESEGWTANTGSKTLSNDLVGARAEIAAARYFEIPHPLHGKAVSHALERQRKWDVGGYEVRGRREAWHGITLRQSDRVRPADLKLMLILHHDYPLMWLVGWTTLGEALLVATEGESRGYPMWFVDKRHLTPFPETALYRRAPTAGPHVAAVAASDLPFWCDDCERTHPIREHRLCRA